MTFFLPSTSDLRYTYLAEKARESGFTVTRTDVLPQGEKCVFLFPLNLGERSALTALEQIAPGSFVFLGKASPAVKDLAQERGIFLVCLLEQERYLLKNAVHTAEGTLAEIIAATPRNLSDLCILIYGYGNCGKAIARLLWLCGCEVWVWSRQRGQALAEQDGFNLFPAPAKGLGMFDGVINTVPAPVFSPEFLGTMRQDAVFFQIASGFSGIDPDQMKSHGLRFLPLHGLPGKYCPASEADAIWDEIQRSLRLKRSIL